MQDNVNTSELQASVSQSIAQNKERKKTARYVFIIALVGIGVLSYLVLSPTAAEKAMYKEMQMVLKDYDSAKFVDVKTYHDGTICGKVNAKNSMGGYIGFKSFNYHHRSNTLTLDADSAIQEIYCK